MAESKYGKYIIYKGKPRPVQPGPPKKTGGEMVMLMDEEVLEGAFYLNCAWIWRTTDEESAVKPHTHDFDEYICFFGSNPEDWYDLNGEVEVWLGDEKHIITKSCAIFVPKGLVHCPIIFRRVDKPIFYFTTAPNLTYEKDDNKE